MASEEQQKTTPKKKAMLNALEKNLCIVTKSAKVAGIERTSHYRWLLEDTDYKKAVDELENLVIDFAEENLHTQISDGNTMATIYLLNNKGKKRGYNTSDGPSDANEEFEGFKFVERKE